MGADEREEGLCGLLDRLVECLRGRVAVFAEDLVLCEEHALCKQNKKKRIRNLLPGSDLSHAFHSRIPPIN